MPQLRRISIRSTVAFASCLLAAGLTPVGAGGQTAARGQAPPVSITPVNVERNVIYGMYSGFALLMDVHRPVTSNGLGIVFVAGSGWQAPLEYGATPLKDTQVPLWGPALVAAGYTVFAVNHRAAPRFRYPAAVEDVQRAVRFIRHHAEVYRIDRDRIGGLGGSSGGHLIGLVSALGEPGIAGDPDPVNRQPATLQTVVLRAPLVDLPKMTEVPAGLALVVSFLGVPLGDNVPTSKALWAQASPQTHVSAKTPPTLLIHGDADDLVPYSQSVGYEAALKAAGVPTMLLTVPGGKHAADFGYPQPLPGWLNYFNEAAKWFDQHLKPSR